MKRLLGLVIIPVAGFLALHRLGSTAGSTRAERHRSLPGDEIVAHPNFITTHAITIDAPPSAIWPWLVQMGWHQGGWYTAPWVDRLLFPANQPASDRILSELQDRKVGDFIPDGPPETECGFTIDGLEAERSLVLHSTSHLPLSWRRDGRVRLSWTWAFVLDDLRDGRTRFIFRCRGRTAPLWFLAVAHLAIVPADFVMSHQMMDGVKTRAERLAAQRAIPVHTRRTSATG
jgi:hypothetical protein